LIFLLIYTLFLLVIVVFGYLAQRMRENGYRGREKDHIDVSELVVIVPFRNEEKRIHVLLKTIEKLNYFPKEFIFVDDHSTDSTVELINKLPKEFAYRVIALPEGVQGKKAGIRHAIEHSESMYLLTIDADVELQPDYFLQIARMSNADMYLMPAVMVADKIHQHLFEVDLLLINAINTGLSGLARPIIASGANLLFKRTAFEKLDRLHTHAHMPSGDDIYLLRDFRVGKADIRLMSDPRTAVHTETPQSFKEFIHQRLRWIAKTGDVKDHLSTTLAVIQALFTFVFAVLIGYLCCIGEPRTALTAFFAKTGIDMLAFMPFFNRVRRIRSWLFIPIYEIIFPIYSLVILGMMYFFKPEWKGRKLERNF
jgi:cellulose synthase/poly-beta-1,6-N-acetylglucosamine synthase-like glycosyltransferase